ncbi:myeloid-associated differentiation marker-like [Hippopotamus amphibius kiboko]|uniref:myeloid-associated differentiation marker-like n=1 Tax=Hippopotamus amphibius kiboko TaxID=575201 RepID=UPI002599560A|nr:myeloid-associated differentiation marker-like [Hippopotamus amphibius kiboko]
MCASSGVGSTRIVGFLLRLGQLLSTCVPFSLLASMGIWREGIGNWCMLVWCLCFTMTLITFILEFCGLQSRFPCSWDGFLHAYSIYFIFLCILTAVIFGTTYIQVFPPGTARNHAITATTFSCVAAVLYVIDVAWICVRPGDMVCYVPTLLGVIRRLENYVACVIFAIISNTYLYQQQPALEWCVFVYAICFILGSVNYFVNGADIDNDKKPVRFPRFLVGQTVLSVFLYASTVVLWPLYQFDEKLGGQPQRSRDVRCSDKLTSLVCIWDQRLAVTVLTAINLLVYVADTVHLAREAFVRTEAQSRGSSFFFSPAVSSPSSDVP